MKPWLRDAFAIAMILLFSMFVQYVLGMGGISTAAALGIIYGREVVQ